MNPIKAWDNLGRNGKIAVVAGVALISVYLWYRSRNANAQAAAATAASSNSTANDDSATDGSDDSSTTDDTSSDDSGYDEGYQAALDTYGSELDDDVGSSAGGGYEYSGDDGTGAGSDVASSIAALGTDLTGIEAAQAAQTTELQGLSAGASGTTGGGSASGTTAPSTAAAHSVTGGPLTKAKTSKAKAATVKPKLPANSIAAPFGSSRPPAKAGYTTIGLGNGYWAYQKKSTKATAASKKKTKVPAHTSKK